jgi:hypothetical protein
MPRKPRIHYTETDKALMWDRWRKGDSLQAIAQLFDRSHGSVIGIQTCGTGGHAFVTAYSAAALHGPRYLDSAIIFGG